MDQIWQKNVIALTTNRKNLEKNKSEANFCDEKIELLRNISKDIRKANKKGTLDKDLILKAESKIMHKKPRMLR